MYTPATGGKIWTVILKDNEGVVETVKAYGVPEILLEPIGHGPLKTHQSLFPNVNSEVFEALPDKELDMLIGNTHLGLQPKCIRGINCPNCRKNLCCYKS